MTSDKTLAGPTQAKQNGEGTIESRPDLSNRALRWLIGGLVLAVICYLIVKPGLPDPWQRPGSYILQPVAALGALLLLVPYLFSFGKRAGFSRIPNKLFILHVGASVAGIFLVSLHVVSGFNGPPLAIAAILVLLVVTGMFGRVNMAPHMASTFGMKPTPFRVADPAVKAQLRQIIDQKVEVLRRLDPAANEALFSVSLKHWATSPLLALAYHRLAQREYGLIGARKSVSKRQAYWRPFHLLLAWLFLAGLVVHVLLVTFFAGYVADGREIYWWHVTAW